MRKDLPACLKPERTPHALGERSAHRWPRSALADSVHILPAAQHDTLFNGTQAQGRSHTQRRTKSFAALAVASIGARALEPRNDAVGNKRHNWRSGEHALLACRPSVCWLLARDKLSSKMPPRLEGAVPQP